MDTIEEPIHIVIRLPYPRPEGYTDTQPVWTEAMDKTLWQLIGHTKPSLVDWHAVSRQLGNVPVPFLIQHAANLYQDQLQDLHRMGEQQDMTTPLQGTSRSTHRGIVGSGAMTAALESGTIAQQPALPFALGAGAPREAPSSGSNTKAQASPSLSSSISTFPVSGRPASMSSSASTIRPVQPSSPSPSPSLRNVVVESNVPGSGIVSNRGGGPSQPRSTRGSQLLGTPLERRLNNQMTALSMSPRDDIFAPELSRPIPEPAHPFHQATLSASVRLTSPTMSTQSARSSPGRSSEHGNNTTGGFQDQDRASTVSSSSTPFSQSNSTSQIFEETSFFNQLPIHESLSRGHQRTETGHHDGSVFQPSPFAQPQGIYGLGFLDQTPFFLEE
ncbi:MAG: hypothetical protein J3Q66DRAFT_429248 [Benniella sp.]|nr:MAG: hypothetical protein J3Q66DRAFT_429248 [Benniella sp.]